MSTQHYAAFIKLDKQDVVEVSTRDYPWNRLSVFLVQENAKILSRVFPRLKSRLHCHAWLEGYAKGKTTKQQTQQNDRQAAQMSWVSFLALFQPWASDFMALIQL